MSKFPVEHHETAVREVGDDEVEVIPRVARGNPWFRFHYSYTEVSATGRTARVKSRSTRYENGKLTNESFDGEIDRNVYERMVGDAQRLFAAQTALFFEGLKAFLPLSGRHRRDRE
jgi:hypothetical protein